MKTCKWTHDDLCGDRYYDSECGENFVFNSGNTKDNGFKYCPYCGKEIVESEEE